MNSKKKSSIELQIGITDLCNYSCIMCMQSAHEGIYGNKNIKTQRLHEKNKGFMSFSLLKKIIEDISKQDFLFNKVAFHWLGESLMHPDFNNILDYSLKKNITDKYTESFILFTNCFFLDNKKADIIIENMKKMENTDFIIVFSLDSASFDTYKKIHRNNHYNKVVKNIKNFVEKTNHIKNIYRIFRFLIMPENYIEANKFYDLWNDYLNGDTQITTNEEKDFDSKNSNNIINFKRVASYNIEEAESLHTDTLNKILRSNKKTYNHFFKTENVQNICAAPFRTPVINWDGSLTVCCPDDSLELIVGNIKEQDFYNIWFGEKINRFRTDHLNKNKKKYKRCNRCSGFNGKPLKKSEITFYDL